jgi:hypothetical protein
VCAHPVSSWPDRRQPADRKLLDHGEPFLAAYLTPSRCLSDLVPQAPMEMKGASQNPNRRSKSIVHRRKQPRADRRTILFLQLTRIEFWLSCITKELQIANQRRSRIFQLSMQVSHLNIHYFLLDAHPNVFARLAPPMFSKTSRSNSIGCLMTCLLREHHWRLSGLTWHS